MNHDSPIDLPAECGLVGRPAQNVWLRRCGTVFRPCQGGGWNKHSAVPAQEGYKALVLPELR
ncbi:MAG: hypothetical protein QF918_00615 [Pirellulaceae bacterium]|nr:hypothetical protein [Pirellulaceae bacterium]